MNTHFKCYHSILFVLSLVTVVASNQFSFGSNKPSFVSSGISNGRNSINNDSIFALRGGEVLELKTLEEVESTILNASLQGKIVVIDFSATWCGPCKMISPLYEQLSHSDDLANKVIFVKVDVDENPDTAMKYNVSAMPTFLFIRKGEVVEKLMGANFPKLESIVRELSN